MTTSTDADDVCRTFLDLFDQASESLDAAHLGRLFAPLFMILGPGQATPVDRDVFIGALRGRRALFEAIHAVGVRRLEGWQSQLDDQHVWVEGRWAVEFAADAPHSAPLELSSAFLLQRSENSWQVVVYLNHHDLQAVLARHTGSPT